MNETWVTVIGNVSSDVTWRRLDGGTVVTNFRMMSNSRRFDAQNGTWADGHLVSVRVNCWRAIGENVSQSVTRGDPVVVHGKLFTRDYETEAGRRSSIEIEARSVGLDLARVRVKVVPRDTVARGPEDVSHLTVVEDDLPPDFDDLAMAERPDDGGAYRPASETVTADEDQPPEPAALAG